MYPVLCVLTLSSWSSLRSEAPHKMVIQSEWYMKNLVLLNSTFPGSRVGSACVLLPSLFWNVEPFSCRLSTKLQKTLRSFKYYKTGKTRKWWGCGKFFFKKKLATAQIDLTESCVSLGLCSVQQTLPVCEVLLYTALPVENFRALLSLGVCAQGRWLMCPF